MRYLFTFALLIAQAAFAQSLWDTPPQTVRDQINREIMAIETEKITVCGVSDITIQHGDRYTSLRKPCHYP